MRATRDLWRRRPHLMRQRAALFAHSHNTTSQYHWPELGQKSAYKATREGVAARFADPAGPKSMEGDWALITHYAQLLAALALAITKAANHHDATPLYLWQTVPGSGQILRLVLLSDIHDMARFPQGPECVSYCRLGTCAQDSAGKRLGTSGKTSGKAHLTWAFSAAAPLFLRNNPAGHKHLARVEHTQGKGKALTSLAHRLARAVYDMLKRQTACAMEQCRHG